MSQNKSTDKKSSTVKASTKKPRQATVATKTKTSAAKKAHSTKKKPQTIESFRPCKDESKFLEFKVTKQTLYWLIISMLVLFLGLWIFKVQRDVHAIYDQIDKIIIEDNYSSKLSL